jgi:signal transduction histidine kinase
MSVLTAHSEFTEQRDDLSASSAQQRRNDVLGASELGELMRLVNETSQRLQATHTSLQSEVARLQRELAEANAALSRSQSLAALGEMAAGIAHEVRNPLGSIQLYVQMLTEDLHDKPAQTEICGKITRAITGLDAIIRDVLSFARQVRIRPQATTAQELFNRALENNYALLSQRVEVSLDDASHVPILADVNLVSQAISNVIRNAVESMLEHDIDRPQLRLRASRKRLCCPNGRADTRVVLSVHDNGPGIPSHVLDRIFNPFFTTRATGTGLGLAIVHRIVDAHGGHVTIDNAADGGANVQLCLPPKPAIQRESDDPIAARMQSISGLPTPSQEHQPL